MMALAATKMSANKDVWLTEKGTNGMWLLPVWIKAKVANATLKRLASNAVFDFVSQEMMRPQAMTLAEAIMKGVV